ncbi:TetR/AcrR family transcriptional regulator [Microbispora corallina]|uniref:TetR family transcriptional regulator n=1 Tax=Microbispora corallina TaxID=83302 RepID=A0ABQ4FS19_9ACTN|nr:TetR/AcrR family transcriptional regulator [Microbispora corallina]GIH37600.1 TetR family transcriptional regulator [Microbispora corallina]
MTRKRRSDAEDNRRRLVEVARAAFAADGLDLPVREIARRAGMGAATVYRHFPSRDDLVAAVLAERVARCEEDMRADLADPDSRRALRGAILRFAERQAHDRGLNDALLGSHAAGAAFAGLRRAHAAAFARLVERARRDGAVRHQVSVEDARTALRAIAYLRALPAPSASSAIPRLTRVLLDGLLNEEESGPGAPTGPAHAEGGSPG